MRTEDVSEPTTEEKPIIPKVMVYFRNGKHHGKHLVTVNGYAIETVEHIHCQANGIVTLVFKANVTMEITHE